MTKESAAALMRLSKRYLQTIPSTPAAKTSSVFSLPSSSVSSPAWASHGLPQTEIRPPRSRPASRAFVPFEKSRLVKPIQETKKPVIETSDPTRSTPQQQPAAAPATEAKPKRKIRARKAAIKLSPTAVHHLEQLLNQPNPKLIRIGVRNRGCSGLTYHLEYVDAPGKFDEEVVQDGVKVLIDSKALFSIIGSEMDWVDDKLASRFVFHNPNSKGQCGCGESFMV